MFFRLIAQSFLRQKRRKLFALVSLALGMSVATGMLTIAAGAGDKVHAQLATLGPNILVTPVEDSLTLEVGGVRIKPAAENGGLRESELPNIKKTFWSHNILGFTPVLEGPVRIGGSATQVGLYGTYFAKNIPTESGGFNAGLVQTFPGWKVEGVWPKDDSHDVALGSRLAARLKFRAGDLIYLADKETRVTGIVTTNGPEDDTVFAPLALAQQILNSPGAMQKVYVRALIKPEDDFARRDPASMSGPVLERWMCSPYANTIAYQVAQAISGSRAEQIRAAAQSESALLDRVGGLMLLVALAALAAAAFSVASAMRALVLERTREIGLMRSLGAGPVVIVSVFAAEGIVMALLGGALGFAIGSYMALRMSLTVFASPVPLQPMFAPISLALALLVVALGSLGAVRSAMVLDPTVVLRGDAA